MEKHCGFTARVRCQVLLTDPSSQLKVHYCTISSVVIKLNSCTVHHFSEVTDENRYSGCVTVEICLR